INRVAIQVVMGRPLVVIGFDQILGQGVFGSLGIIEVAGVGKVVAVGVGEVERSGRNRGIGLEIGDELQAVGRPGGQAAGADSEIGQNTIDQRSVGVGGITLQAHAIGADNEIIGILVEHAGAAVAHLAALVPDHEKALAGDRQVEIATGKFLGAIFIEVLGHLLHFHATGLATGIDGSQFRPAGLKAGGGD